MPFSRQPPDLLELGVGSRGEAPRRTRDPRRDRLLLVEHRELGSVAAGSEGQVGGHRLDQVAVISSEW